LHGLPPLFFGYGLSFLLDHLLQRIEIVIGKRGIFHELDEQGTGSLDSVVEQ
jgi:hypothetical protein